MRELLTSKEVIAMNGGILPGDLEERHVWNQRTYKCRYCGVDRDLADLHKLGCASVRRIMSQNEAKA